MVCLQWPSNLVEVAQRSLVSSAKGELEDINPVYVDRRCNLDHNCGLTVYKNPVYRRANSNRPSWTIRFSVPLYTSKAIRLEL